jgi:hypothetical protein
MWYCITQKASLSSFDASCMSPYIFDYTEKVSWRDG